MLTLRLQRAGSKNKPEFRIVLAQREAAANKKFVEILGNYNPRTKAFSIKDEARLKYWVEQHVAISPTLNNLLISKNLLNSSKLRAFNVPTKVKAKRAEEEAKAKADAEAQAAAAAEAETAQADAAETTEESAPEAPVETPEQPTEATEETPAEEPKTEAPAETPAE
jgi:small subunit ribosomal protein S16